MPPASSSSTSVAITNPLVLYRSLIATKRIQPDIAQYRLAVHLQKLYERLKDYEPIVEYRHRLNQISRALGNTPGQESVKNAPAASSGPAAGRSSRLLDSLFPRNAEKESLALTRALTSHEEVLELDSPKGLMLHGEVGTGKSMLIDLFADCLPHRKKKRLHFTTFMLETFAKLEQLRRSRQLIIPSSLGQQDDYSLLFLARDMISTSPILFLDEFQLPDRTASKIVTNLMTCFFHLGGVLVATSNRMPEELAKAAGVEFTAPPSTLDSLRWRFGLVGSGSKGKSERMYAGNQDFAAFLEVLKARCEVWQMENTKDYRRQDVESSIKDNIDDHSAHHLATQGFEGLDDMSAGNIGLGYEQSKPIGDAAEGSSNISSNLPKNYLIRPSDDAGISQHSADSFARSFSHAQAAAFEDPDITETTSVPWESATLRVYGRDVLVPRHHRGVTCWTFLELCAGRFGPADYITLASSYHTLILIDVPVLSLLQKNEARRFITLLDALYEARCKLLITADADPDSLFFPETKNRATSTSSPTDEESVDQDQIMPETLSEIYQDATAPFRPNISVYGEESYTGSAPAEPDTTHSRLAGMFAEDQLEDGPPNSPRRSNGSPNSRGGIGRGDSIFGLDPSVEKLQEQLATQRTAASGPDFSRAGIFTGEDERFAYKRARSRLWEMCGARWWERSEKGWWRPLDQAARSWERGAADNYTPSFNPSISLDSAIPTDDSVVASNAPSSKEGMGGSRGLDEKQDEVLFRHDASPFRTNSEPPPKFSWTHAWGMMKWGKKAGAWGKGVEGLEEAKEERKRRKEQDRNDNTSSVRKGT